MARSMAFDGCVFQQPGSFLCFDFFSQVVDDNEKKFLLIVVDLTDGWLHQYEITIFLQCVRMVLFCV